VLLVRLIYQESLIQNQLARQNSLSGLRSIQEALELVLDVARDRRLLLLEVAVVVLILAELIFTVLRVL